MLSRFQPGLGLPPDNRTRATPLRRAVLRRARDHSFFLAGLGNAVFSADEFLALLAHLLAFQHLLRDGGEGLEKDPEVPAERHRARIGEIELNHAAERRVVLSTDL